MILALVGTCAGSAAAFGAAFWSERRRSARLLAALLLVDGRERAAGAVSAPLPASKPAQKDIPARQVRTVGLTSR